MARISYTVYKNSALATILSFLGSAYITMGAMIFAVGFISNELKIAESIILLICFVLLGLLHLQIAKHVNEKKIFKLWMKAIQKQGAEYKIIESVEYALQVYKSYPTKRMLNYISKLNPKAAQMIQQNNM